MSRQICIPFMKTSEQLADLLTKELSSPSFQSLTSWGSALSTHQLEGECCSRTVVMYQEGISGPLSLLCICLYIL